MLAFCSRCGAALPDEASYCWRCGVKIVREKPGVKREEFEISGGQLLDKVRELIHEGNIRRIVIKQKGKPLIEIPLTIAVVGAVVAPVLAAVGAVAALVTDCTVTVERLEGG
ncbi:MAG: DUF4342 domain-containing protein [Candidatus Bathyarchaeia archaeon]